MSYTICSRFKGEHIVYAGYTICTSREHIVYGAFCGSTLLINQRWLGDLMKKSISPVGIDVEISQLPLDVRSKTTNFQKCFLFFTLIMFPPFRVGRHIVFPRASVCLSVRLSVCLSVCHKSCPLYNLKTA